MYHPAEDSRTEDIYIASGQAAHLLNVSPATIRRWVLEGRLQPQSQTAGGHFRFRLSYIRRMMQQFTGNVESPAEEPDPRQWWDETGDEPETRQRPASDSGQSLVEFAIVLPVLLLIVLGFLAFADMFRQVHAMSNAANSGSFYASLGHDAGEVETLVRQQLSEQLVNPDSVTVAVIPPAYNYGDPITVAITKTMRLDALLWRQTFALPIRSTQIVQKQVITGTLP